MNAPMPGSLRPNRTAVALAFGSALKARRASTHISQEELAERLDADRTYLSRRVRRVG